MTRPESSRSRSASPRAAAAPPAPGVIETIATGLSLALVYPLLALTPLLTDGLLWSGLRVTPAAFKDGSTPRDVLESLGLDNDLLPIVSLFVPSLLAWIDRDEIFTAGNGLGWTLTSSWLVAAAALALVMAATLAYAMFKVPVAYVMRHEPMRPKTLVRSVGTAWLRLSAFGIVVFAATILLTLPLGVAGALLYLVGLNITPLIVLAIGVPAVLAAIYLWFAPDAIVFCEIGPFRACYLSVNVVRGSFWRVVGLIASVALISGGLPALWLSQADHPIGLLIGVFCNAMLATGLAAASMQFFADRLGRWQRVESAGAQTSSTARSA